MCPITLKQGTCRVNAFQDISPLVWENTKKIKKKKKKTCFARHFLTEYFFFFKFYFKNVNVFMFFNFEPNFIEKFL